jgi:hypothetical protein
MGGMGGMGGFGGMDPFLMQQMMGGGAGFGGGGFGGDTRPPRERFADQLQQIKEMGF